ncbi:MAG: deoxyribose-phosphate aldolase [Lactobacillales bacterium]|jgi:deoxyribose-phosphate aldolase|nr:deoxyribose-phosphate aldolase [Lactobacillales bacterium]
MNLAKMIDHTLLKPNLNQVEVQKAIEEAKYYGFYALCVAPMWVAYAAENLRNSKVKVCTVIGFPLGANTSETKAYEAKEAILNGADEVDMVINIAALKSGHYKKVVTDIQVVVEAVKGTAKVKVIIETGLLTDKEKIKTCELVKQAKADFIKTSTGFVNGGANAKDITLIRKVVGVDMGIKASGKIFTADRALAMIKAGANRIGTSAGVAILKNLESVKFNDEEDFKRY